MARKEKAPSLKELENQLLNNYSKWKHTYLYGCSDPNWEDGMNLNLTRNHIISLKKEIEKCLGDNLHLYPDCYFFPVPWELPNTFMSVGREITCKRKFYPATKTLPYSEVLKFYWGEVLPCPLC